MLSSIVATCDPAINRPFGIVGWSESSIRMRDQATAKAFLFFSANLPRCRLLQAQSVLIMWLSLRDSSFSVDTGSSRSRIAGPTSHVQHAQSRASRVSCVYLVSQREPEEEA